MLGQRELTMEDVTGILRRGWLYIVIPLLAVPVIALGVAYFLSPKYTSQSLVMIEQQHVPDSVVKSVVQENLIARISTMQTQVLSRSKLQPMIERYGLYKSEIARGVGMDDLLMEMRADILVTPVPSVLEMNPGAAKIVMSQKDIIPGFIVSFTSDRAKTARDVCEELTSDFIQANLVERSSMADETTTFLGNQLQEAKRKVDEEDAKLTLFQKKYAGELPDDEKNNLTLLQSVTSRLEVVSQNLQHATQEKTYTESLLAQQLSYWDQIRAGGRPESTDKEIATAEDRLAAMQARYTPDHPDVIKMKAAIQGLKKARDTSASGQAQDGAAKAGTADRSQGSPALEPPDLQKLRSTLRSLEEAISTYKREQVLMAQEAKRLEARLQMSPVVDAEFKAVTRDAKTADDFYNTLLSEKNSSGMATDLERGEHGEHFKLLDPASLPETPSFPVYWMFAVGGAVGGLVIGFAIVLLRELKDKAIRTERDIEFFMELPTLVLLPSVGEIQKRKNGRIRTWWGKRRKAAVKQPAEHPVQA
jgi:uncharacterized protein involved in exopolysaccharide biosynthesis